MTTSLAKLSDAEIITRLRQTCRQADRLLGELIRLLMEVDQRRLHLSAAYPTLFEFCRTELGFSESEAYRRSKAARIVQRFPGLLPHIDCGDIRLTTLLQLRDHFTDNNVEELVAVTKRRTKEQVAEFVARLAPRPDVPAKLRKLPQHDARCRVTKASRPSIEPLSESRYRLQITGSRAFRDKLLRARDLMMHGNPSGDLAVVVERAIDELLEVLEKRVFGTLSRKREKAPAKVSSLRETTLEPRAAPAPPNNKTTSKKAALGRGPGLARAPMDSRGRGHDAATHVRHIVSGARAAASLRQRK